MKGVILTIALLIVFTTAKPSATKRELNFSALPKELSGRLAMAQAKDDGSSMTMGIHFDLDLNQRHLRFGGTYQGTSYTMYLDFNQGMWYYVMSNHCFKGTAGVPSLENVQGSFLGFQQITSPGILGLNGATVEVYSAKIEESFVVLTVETDGNNKIPVSAASKDKDQSWTASFLDLRKSVDPEMWKIPEDCSTLEKRAPTSGIVSAMLHAAHLQQAMKRGFPWISRGLVTQKRGFPWFGK